MAEKQGQSENLRRQHSRRAEMELRESLAKRLAAYALAAGGAGLGIMAGAETAGAQIVYTPANIHFDLKLELDINHDGMTDFVLDQFLQCTCSSYFIYKVTAFGPPGNSVVASASNRCSFSFNCVSRLARGAKIGPGAVFKDVADELVAGTIGGFLQDGQWKDNASGFLGLKFKIDGEIHYGWAEVTIFASRPVPPFRGPFRGIVKGYAYNTVANEPILAGETGFADSIGEAPPQAATLGLLALGAPGLDIWRPRKRELAAA